MKTGHAAIKTLQSLRMSNPPFTDDDEGCPKGGVCVVSGTGVDLGLPVGLGTGEAGLCSREHAGG